MTDTAAGTSRWESALARARDIKQDRLVAEPLEVLLAEIVESVGPQPILIDYASRFASPQEDRFDIRYPCTGSLSYMGAEYSAHGAHHELTYHVFPEADDDFTPEKLERDLATLEARLQQEVRSANEKIEHERQELVKVVLPVLERRWGKVRVLRGTLAALSIPLEKSPVAVHPIPARPAPLSLTAVTAAAARGQHEWVLADELAEGVTEAIASFGRSLERSPSAAGRLVGGDEETLRDVLLCILNATYNGLLTGETFIGDGKSDLLLRWRDRDAFVGECKIWKGQAGLKAGMDQLLTRYTLWRQSRVALVVFIDKPSDATAIIDKAHAAVREHPRTTGVIDASEPERRGDYQVTASGDERRPAQLTLLPVVLRKPRDN
jgi:hypothetical protein